MGETIAEAKIITPTKVLVQFKSLRKGQICGGIFIYLGTARRGARPAHGCVAGWGYREIVWREKEGAFLECAG